MTLPRHASQSLSAGMSQPKGQVPLLVHFDVNKTVIQSDSIQMKGIEDGIREGIAELFWGYTTQKDAHGDSKQMVWEWAKDKPSCYPPVEENFDPSKQLMNYFEFCRRVVQDKDKRKQIIKTFKLVGEDARAEMDKLLHVTMKQMQLPQEVRYSKAAEEAGLKGATVAIFPTLFHFVAALQRTKRPFAILFRSFGADHEKIKCEWNAFCEMRHPVYSKFIEGVGPLDGTVPGIPDRRIHAFHTLYRDEKGPMLIKNTFTNGPNEKSWDSWAKQKPKPTVDDRGGRSYVTDILQAELCDGMEEIQGWMRNHLDAQETAAIKDDWAWWQWHGEKSYAGKLLTLFGDDAEQLFFDDNIEISDTRIVDCRDTDGYPVPSENAINKICTKVNPVEALLDIEYFLRKLQLCHGGSCDMGASLIDFQRRLTEVEDQKVKLNNKVKLLELQLQTLTGENRRLKLARQLNVRSEGQLKGLLAESDYELDIFGKNGFRSISDLFWELQQGHCWLEHDENGKIIRSFEMVFMKILFKSSEWRSGSEDIILIESHEQGSDGGVQSRNYTPGVRKVLRAGSFQTAIDRWIQSGLGVDLKDCVVVDSLPLFVPEAPIQQTTSTQAYPIPCKVQQSETVLIIAGKSVMTHQELLGKIGLPSGKHFTAVDQDIHGGPITRFFRWDKIATWEAQASAKGVQKSHEIEVPKVIAQLFKGHPRKEEYKKLLLQMFDVFTANKLCGGFSGSIVIRVQPFESDGRPGEPCIVKLDLGDAIRDEYQNSVNVFRALPDRAARILGDAVYAKNEAGEEFGAMRLELAGACWNVPELAQGAGNLLSTFKDLLLYESQQLSAGSNQVAGDIRPFGNVNSVLAETFGPGGVVGSLRKGGDGLHRSAKTPLLWGWYTLKGKPTKFNPFTSQKDYPPTQQMRQMYNKYFGVDMPDLKELVENNIKPRLQQLAERATVSGKKDLFPLIALGHGDLNAANIMIDALDAVWLIDFATSVDLPLFTDMCKFEMACLFEYATIPITPRLLLDFASCDRAAWQTMNVGDWLRVDQDIAEVFMRALADRQPNNLSNMGQEELHELIETVVAKAPIAIHKQREASRALKACLCVDESEIDCAFKYCESISQTLLVGDYIFDSLNVKAPQPGAHGQRGASSLKFFMDIAVSIRRFMFQDLMGCLRDWGRETLEPCDALSLQLWLPILRESYRLVGYRDITPQHKIWSIYHCSIVANNVIRMLDRITNSFDELGTLDIMSSLEGSLANTKVHRTTRGDFFAPRTSFSEADSHWIHKHAEAIPHGDAKNNRLVRKVHSACPVYASKPGFFAPVLQIIWSDNAVRNLRGFQLSSDHAGAIPISFDDAPDGTLTLHLKDVNGSSVVVEDEPVPLFDTVIGRKIGTITPGSAAHLKSRLFSVTTTLLKAKLESLTSTPVDYVDDFDLAAWSGGLFGAQTMPVEVTPKKMGDHSQWTAQGSLLPTEHQKFLQLEMVACDADGVEVYDGITLVLGIPSLCYPVGIKLCIDSSVIPQQRSLSSEVVVVGTNDNGMLNIRDAGEPDPDMTGENDLKESKRDFSPSCNNHVFLTPCEYKIGQKIIVNKDHNSWVDCEVIKESSQATDFRYRLLSMIPSMGSMMSERLGSWDASSGQRPKDVGEKEKVDRHVNSMNSGFAWLSASNYEEEVHKFKVWMRARHSFIIDALSGMRLGVKACAVPTLHIVSKSGDAPSLTTRMISNLSTVSTPTPPGVSPASRGRKSSFAINVVESGGPDVRHGWNSIVSAVARYEKAEASCSPNGFLILGPPGSGKSCLVCRLVMDCLETHQNLVPILLAVTDLIKRSTSEDIGDNDSAASSAWFDKYLRLTFGEDSPRYKMVRQAICMHRAVFVFEGLEDIAGWHLAPVIERFIRDLVFDRHFVVITSRPMSEDQKTSLEAMETYISKMELQNLTDEQQRAIAHSRLGLEGLNSFDQFCKQLRESQSVGVDKEGVGQDSVFGNPMMLSMLLCYLQIKQKEKGERATSRQDGEEDRVTLTAVYRVAVDVMLTRVQSKQQAERHNKDEKVKQCMRILEKMAMRMQVQQSTKIDVNEFEKSLTSDLRSTWDSLKAAVIAGHAVFLRMSTDAEDLDFHFLVKGFQDFFAASEVGNGGGDELPRLESLLTDPWWAQVLEMLAENWGWRYVRLIENALEKFEPNNGNTFLHLAANVGHLPVFTLLKQFSETHQAALCSPNSEKQVPLHVAAREGNMQICALMIQHKAPVDAEDASERLPMHAAMQQRHFHTAKFLLEAYMETRRNGDTDTLQRSGMNKEHPAERLAAKILGHNGAKPFASDAEFQNAVDEAFPELRFFANAEKRDRKGELGALLSVLWVCAGQYEQFIRVQPEGERLTKSSWAKVQEWTHQTVQLTSSPARVGAMLVFVAIMSLGKIEPLRKTFAPDFGEANDVLRNILETTPSLIPSFSRMDMHSQAMIMSSLKAMDFNLGQFLQGENLPGNLVILKEILGERQGNSENVLGFFLFKIFASMCGLFGIESLEGSKFMTEQNYQNYRRGLEVLQFVTQESPIEVYNRFLEKRAAICELPFSPQNNESRAIVRLACMTRFFDATSGKKVSEAFYSMDPQDRDSLTSFLNADGISKQGFLLYNAPEIMAGANSNSCIGLVEGMKMLLRIYQQAEEEYSTSEHMLITIMCMDIAKWTKNCHYLEVFQFTKFEIRRTSRPKFGSAVLSPWQKNCNQKELEDLGERGEEMAEKTAAQVLREPHFLKQLEDIFPELRYFVPESESSVKEYLRQTYSALLVVYWTASDQAEAFTRGQVSDKKLSDRSWKMLTGMHAAMSTVDDYLNVVFVCVALQNLGKLPKFKAQLAPHVFEPEEVMAYVLESCPEVLPSYMRLEPDHKKLAQLVLTRGFKFQDFIRTESLPANLTPVKEMVRSVQGTDLGEDCMQVFLLVCFAELAGCLGHESTEGSLYMTEDAFVEFWSGKEAVQKLVNSDEKDVYDSLLTSLAEEKGLPTEFQDEKGLPTELRAGVRLACMAQEKGTLQAMDLAEAVRKSFSKEERAAMTAFLNADGISEKPAFILRGTPAFLRSALANTEVDIKPAVRILLKVYMEAAKKFEDSACGVVVIQLGKLVSSAKTFSGSGAFQDMPFELQRLRDCEGLVIPKRWIPVTNPEVLTNMREQGRQLASELIGKKISEENFRERLGRIFPELSYFSSQGSQAEMAHDQTMGALLSIFWLVTGQHESFIRGQPTDDQLSLKSWAWIQEWIEQTKLLSTTEAVDAALVFMAIHALGKIPEFRKELVPGNKAHIPDVALAHILDDQPELVPSFSGLDEKYRTLIIHSVGVDFQFRQFLQAENTPANLVLVEEKLAPHGDHGFAFFCFRVFTQLCGRDGNISLKGSLFMKESMFQRFRPGLDVLQLLRTLGASATYQAFLLLRSSQAMPRFASPEHQALARLLCLGSAFDNEGGRVVCEAFDQLLPEERDKLTKWLNSDGIKQHPDFVLCSAADLLANSRNNTNVGLAAGLRMLLMVQDKVLEAIAKHNPSKVVLHLSNVASWAKACGSSAGEFFQANLTVDLKIHSGTAVVHVTVQPISEEDGLHATTGSVALPAEISTTSAQHPSQRPTASVILAETTPAAVAQDVSSTIASASTKATLITPGDVSRPDSRHPTPVTANAGAKARVAEAVRPVPAPIIDRSIRRAQSPDASTGKVTPRGFVSQTTFSPTPRVSVNSAPDRLPSSLQCSPQAPPTPVTVFPVPVPFATPPGPPGSFAGSVPRVMSQPSVRQPVRMSTGPTSSSVAGFTPPAPYPQNGKSQLQPQRMTSGQGEISMTPPRVPYLSGQARTNGSVSLRSLDDAFSDDASNRSIPTIAVMPVTGTGSDSSASSSARHPPATAMVSSFSSGALASRPVKMATTIRVTGPPDSPGSISSRSAATVFPVNFPPSVQGGFSPQATATSNAAAQFFAERQQIQMNARSGGSQRPFWQGFSTAQASPFASHLEPETAGCTKASPLLGGPLALTRTLNVPRLHSPVHDRHIAGPPPLQLSILRERSPSKEVLQTAPASLTTPAAIVSPRPSTKALPQTRFL